MIELWHSKHSTCSQKVRLVLEEKGLAWTGHHLNLRRFDHLLPAFLALNPAAMVPVLKDAGQVIVESRIINEYLEDAYPDVPLAPRDPFARVRMRLWTRYSDEVLTHAIKLPSFAKNIAPELARMDPAEVAAMVEKIPNPAVRARWQRAATAGINDQELALSIAQLADMAARMDAALAEGPWLAGETLSLADIDVVPYVQRLVRVELFHLVAARPRVADWYARISARPAYRKAMPAAGSEGT
ncbi:MAG: glutathione S-transferase family protein [Burkholderiales bacterium]|nr:glutathione S-transferase family protein [Burkholderiales bacterium]